MTIQVNLNITTTNSHRNLLINSTELAKPMDRLSSELKINRSAEGPAALAIIRRLRTQTAGLEQVANNSEARVSPMQTAEAILDKVSMSLISTRQLTEVKVFRV